MTKDEINWKNQKQRDQEQAQEYLQEIKESKNEKETMQKIIKTERNNTGNKINTILTILLLLFIIYAWTDGRYISKEIIQDTKIIEICQGQPTQESINKHQLKYTGNKQDTLKDTIKT